MAKGKDIHIAPNGKGGWHVKPEGGVPVSNHRTQDAAIDKGRPIARRNESELVIHRRDGTIRDSDSHGHDPNPPRDKR
jgi:Uncharacterized protein conserved in bacteria (DUF2188)